MEDDYLISECSDNTVIERAENQRFQSRHYHLMRHRHACEYLNNFHAPETTIPRLHFSADSIGLSLKWFCPWAARLRL